MTASQPRSAPAVGYVLTHYPRLAQTFIAGEVDQLERLGFRVVTSSLNDCSPDEANSPEARAARERTYYVKSASASTIARLLLTVAATRPLALARLILKACRTGGTDVKAVVWRFFYVVEGIVLWHHLSERGIRHVHAHFGQSPASVAWFAAEVGRLMDGLPWTWGFTIHGFQDFVNERDARLDLKAADAAYVICVSDFTRSQLMRVTSPDHWEKYRVVRCGIDLDQFAYREPLAVSSQPVIAIVARVSAEKGHMVLLRALRDLHNQGIDAQVEVIGSGEFLEAVSAYGQRMGVADSVVFSGELTPNDVLDRLRAADIFCLPSFAEGLPVSMMEAMAIGVPVVTTFISGIPELAVHDRTALVVPAGNSDALASALATVLRDSDLRQRLAAAAREAVEMNHSITTNGALLASVLLEQRSVDTAQ